MAIELTVPSVGESITEVQIGEWLVAEGDHLERDQPVVEIESEKATVEVFAPVAGTLTRIAKKTGETAAVGEVIGHMEAGEAKAAAPVVEPAVAAVDSGSNGSDGEQIIHERTPIMPAARRVLAQEGIAEEKVQPTGPGGRMLKEDVLRVANAVPQSPPAAVASAPSSTGDEVVAMSPMRRTIAARLVEAQQTAALLTTFNEIDMSAVIAARKRHQDAFIKKYDIKLGFMSFFIKACVDALKLFPAVNAEIRGTDVVYHNRYDVGIAVGGGKGLVVPVIRNCDRLSFAQIEQTIADFGQRAKKNRIAMDELKDGTFTITNGGIYGSMLSTPIVNPPQSGILGLHNITQRPVAVDGEVVIRPMMYVALTYDHRIVDGREAVTFLMRIKECIENPSRMLLEI